MSELSVYELEDIAWDELCLTDDHRVPGSNKKPCHGTNVRYKSSNKNVCVEKVETEEIALNNNRKKRMLENKEDDNNSFSFFDETHDIKDSGDFLYYGWSDIGNLEDVDRIFRNEDEFGWFGSSEDVEGSNSEFKFSSTDSSPVENKSKNCFEHLSLSVNDTFMNDAPVISKGSSWLQENESNKDQSLDHFSFVNRINSSDTKEADFMPIKQPTHGDRSQGEKQHQLLVRESSGQLPCNYNYTNSDYSFTSDQTSEYGTLSPVKRDNIGFKSLQNMAISATIQENSSVVSLEDASFCQLQHVIEQLDPRIKLCIRDSLYRLARDAAQCPNDANLDQDTCIFETTNKCTEFIDMEDDTNPIDRSIAHLLFHRSSAPPPPPPQEFSFHHNTPTAVSY